MKKMLKYTMLLLGVFFAFTALGTATFAYSQTKDWNGKAGLKNDISYIVTEDVVISGSRTLPTTARITVKNGAVLTVAKGASFTVKGQLIINDGAQLVNNGKITAAGKSAITVKGDFAQNGVMNVKTGGKLKIKGSVKTGKSSDSTFDGKLEIFEGSSVVVYGGADFGGDVVMEKDSKLNIYSAGAVFKKTSSLKSSGSIVFKSGSAVTVGGNFAIHKSGSLIAYGDTSVRGVLTVKKSGILNVRGRFETAAESKTTIAGKLKIYSSADFTQRGSLTVSSSGRVYGSGKIMSADYNAIANDGTIEIPCHGVKKVADGLTYYGGLILANKQTSLPSDYAPELDEEAYAAYRRMYKAASAAGFGTMNIISGYRPYSYQKTLFAYWCSIYGEATASTLSARPGTSEHQTGLALDITSCENSYANTDEAKWLAENCYDYGFIIRYPKDKVNITGYIYEPWHIRYVGVNAAKLIKDSGLCLEEFFGIA